MEDRKGWGLGSSSVLPMSSLVHWRSGSGGARSFWPGHGVGLASTRRSSLSSMAAATLQRGSEGNGWRTAARATGGGGWWRRGARGCHRHKDVPNIIKQIPKSNRAMEGGEQDLRDQRHSGEGGGAHLSVPKFLVYTTVTLAWRAHLSVHFRDLAY